MKRVLDYTTRRVSSSCDVCPKCGRVGLATPMPRGGTQYTHRKELQPAGYYRVIDYCVAAATSQEPQ